MTLSIVKANVDNIRNNKYRDFNMAPIREDKILSLMNSINKTDFWNNMNLRLKDNTLADGTIVSTQADIDALVSGGHDFSQEIFEIPYGHQRLEALRRLEWTIVELPLKHFTDETMLRMMAEENKAGYGSDTGVKCETVKQVTDQINADLQSFAGFAEYKAAGNTLFVNAKTYDKAKKDGVGFRKVREFLGDTWSESDIRGAFKILKLIDAGYITQEDVGSVASMGLLETVGAIAEFMYEGKKDVEAPDMPLYWKRELINNLLDMCAVDAKGWQKVTVATLRRARTAFEKDGVNPAGFLKNANAKTPFDFVKATKDLIFDPDKAEEYNYAKAEELATKDGFMEYADIQELIDRVKKSIKASFARLASGTEDEEEDTIDPTTEDDLQNALDAESNAVAVPDLFGAAEGTDGDVVTMPASQLVDTYCQTAAHIGHGTSLLLADLDNIGDNPSLDMAVDELLRATIKLGMARLSREAIVSIFNSETK